jgi:hypothetical protein
MRDHTIKLHERLERVILRVVVSPMSILATQCPRAEVRALLQFRNSFDLRPEL